MNSKALLLATAAFSAFISASAFADGYRAKGSPISSIPGDSGNGENAATAAIGFVADKVRVGTTVSGMLDTSLTPPTRVLSQIPAAPVIAFTAVEGGVTATAPAPSKKKPRFMCPPSRP